jgi:hypothetical protein
VKKNLPKKPISCKEPIQNLKYLQNVASNKSQPLDFDSFFFFFSVEWSAKSFKDIKSNIFHVNRDTFMKETGPTKLKKIHSKDKTVFLDTVVFGIVFRKPKTMNQLDNFIKKARKDMYKIWSHETTYVTPSWEELPA